MSDYNTTNNLFLTNNYSIISKYSAVKAGYFSDKVLEDFIENQSAVKWRRTPLVNRGYAARLLAVDWIVKRSIRFETVNCFIILGAGYSTLPFQKQAEQCCHIEIDLPEVISTKSKYIIERKILDGEELIQLEDGIFSSTLNSYHLIACDLRDTSRLSKVLRSVISRLSGIQSVAILNEICLCYLKFEENKAILSTIIDTLRNSAFKVHYIGYEQVKPFENSQMSRVMLDHFESLGYPLLYFPSPKTIKTLLVDNLNFNHVTVSSMYQIYHNALQGTIKEIEAFCGEPFDEYEEMDLYLSHYALVTGILILKDPFLNPNISTTFKSGTDELNSQLEALKVQDNRLLDLLPSPITRFAHTSCIYDEKTMTYSILVTGGFGKSETGSNNTGAPQQHRRLNDCSIMTYREDGDSFEYNPLILDKFPSERICLGRMHGQVGKVDGNLIFFNGGRQSPTHKPSTMPFLAGIQDSSLIVEHEFPVSKVSAWRHKISAIYGDELYQVGGIRDQSSQPLLVWNFSSSKLGYREVMSSCPEVFERHSCDIDMIDENSMIIFGGLKTTKFSLDKPVDVEYSAVIWDRRLRAPIPLDLGVTSHCYGSSIHFIGDNKFIKIGGVSTINGLENTIEQVDIRNLMSVPILKKFDDDQHMILINTSTLKFEKTKKILSIGGGGNYFTFGTCFNKYLMEYCYGD